MKIFEQIKDLQTYIQDYKNNHKVIGFVPTMGALHQGHISLVEEAKNVCDIVVVSIFVNPTQFNDPKDLHNYPRTMDKDTALLQEYGVDIVFCPSVETIYPQKDERVFNVGKVAEVMEGKYRPGHFNGVMQVVSRLFDIIRPDKAFFGEKDFQQIAVIKAMVKLLNIPVEIVRCPIYRSTNGLALSSRNMLLSKEQQAIAPQIYATLREAVKRSYHSTPREVIDWVIKTLNSEPYLQVEYFDIVDRDSLLPITTWTDSEHIQGCITVFCGSIRLIDNICFR